ncbi:hypothetical protein [Pseudorhodobacter ferrugineus]|uniref:hypothetical protein n=1 Tax=Pseudorhodobacter ferrugineus TaxID=77008 RepID=UPI0003F73CA1|nr:hypothetical protein [Pseudorhodobacter ferrugineus]
MSLIRPEAQAALWRFREMFASLGLALIGLWLAVLGGFILVPLGAGIIVLAAGFGLLAWRRLRFAQSGDAPGMVELDEGQISYFGPDVGGAVALRDLVELRLITAGGRRMWRLRQQDGQVLAIPVSAMGADQLFDAFAALPGMDTGALVAAVDPVVGPASVNRDVVSIADSRVIWRHPVRAVLT